eukprot:GILK01026069.1.p2 GENE.GILK01026069.1~~GILK01026069.1.p2  ORF type:complete len:141 (-),score=23.67 GILK01026069.1:362-784(-)
MGKLRRRPKKLWRQDKATKEAVLAIQTRLERLEERISGQNPKVIVTEAQTETNPLRKGGQAKKRAKPTEIFTGNIEKFLQPANKDATRQGVATRSQSASQQNSDASESSGKEEDGLETSQEPKEAKRRTKKHVATEPGRK